MLRIVCGRCTFASPKCVQQISYISFEIARVAPINRQVCAITGKPRPAGGLQKAKEVVEHLATCSRFTPDLHFGAAAALQGGDRNSLTWLSWVPAQPEGSSPRTAATKGHLWHPAAKATLPSLSPAQLAVTFPLCFNRLLSVSLNAGKRVFYVPCKRESEWRKEECWFEGGGGEVCASSLPGYLMRHSAHKKQVLPAQNAKYTARTADNKCSLFSPY